MAKVKVQICAGKDELTRAIEDMKNSGYTIVVGSPESVDFHGEDICTDDNPKLISDVWVAVGTRG